MRWEQRKSSLPVSVNFCLRTVKSGGQGTLKDPGEQTGEVGVCIDADGHITKRLLISLFGHVLFHDHLMFSLFQGVQKDTPAMPQRFRIFRSPMGMFVGASRSPYTWSSPGCSPALRWRPPTSKWVRVWGLSPPGSVGFCWGRRGPQKWTDTRSVRPGTAQSTFSLLRENS